MSKVPIQEIGKIAGCRLGMLCYIVTTNVADQSRCNQLQGLLINGTVA